MKDCQVKPGNGVGERMRPVQHQGQTPAAAGSAIVSLAFVRYVADGIRLMTGWYTPAAGQVNESANGGMRVWQTN
jgi:hypothetical protein